MTGPEPLTQQGMERLIRTYFDACNAADPDAIAACFVEDAVHYFPPGMYGGPFEGAGVDRALLGLRRREGRVGVDGRPGARRSGQCARRHRVDPLQDLRRHGASRRRVVRVRPGSGLIREIRAYYASPQAPIWTGSNSPGSTTPPAGIRQAALRPTAVTARARRALDTRTAARLALSRARRAQPARVVVGSQRRQHDFVIVGPGETAVAARARRARLRHAPLLRARPPRADATTATRSCAATGTARTTPSVEVPLGDFFASRTRARPPSRERAWSP